MTALKFATTIFMLGSHPCAYHPFTVPMHDLNLELINLKKYVCESLQMKFSLFIFKQHKHRRFSINQHKQHFLAHFLQLIILCYSLHLVNLLLINNERYVKFTWSYFITYLKKGDEIYNLLLSKSNRKSFLAEKNHFLPRSVREKTKGQR